MTLPTGQKCSMKFQVGDNMSKYLASVERMTANQNTVVFDERGSYIYNKPTGEVIWMTQEDGQYHFDAWVDEPSFQRQGS